MRRLGVAGTARASFYVYNDDSDVEELVEGLVAATEVFRPGPRRGDAALAPVPALPR
jgi:hypothetical protein